MVPVIRRVSRRLPSQSPRAYSSVWDSFDALTSHRPYRKARARNATQRDRGRVRRPSMIPAVVMAFLRSSGTSGRLSRERPAHKATRRTPFSFGCQIHQA
jgi:hypothetical protein